MAMRTATPSRPKPTGHRTKYSPPKNPSTTTKASSRTRRACTATATARSGGLCLTRACPSTPPTTRCFRRCSRLHTSTKAATTSRTRLYLLRPLRTTTASWSVATPSTTGSTSSASNKKRVWCPTKARSSHRHSARSAPPTSCHKSAPMSRQRRPTPCRRSTRPQRRPFPW